MIEPCHAVGEHVLREDLTGESHAAEVDAKDAVPFFIGDVEERCRGVDPRAVHQDVAMQTALAKVGNQSIEVVTVCGIAGRELGRASRLLDSLHSGIAMLAVAADDDAVGSRAGEGLTDGPSQDSRAADDDGGASLQAEEFLKIRCDG